MKRLGIGVQVRVAQSNEKILLGLEGVICRVSATRHWVVSFTQAVNHAPGAGPSNLSTHEGTFWSDQLEPLLSPGTDEWAREKVKNLDRFYVEPTVEKERA